LEGPCWVEEMGAFGRGGIFAAVAEAGLKFNNEKRRDQKKFRAISWRGHGKEEKSIGGIRTRPRKKS